MLRDLRVCSTEVISQKKIRLFISHLVECNTKNADSLLYNIKRNHHKQFIGNLSKGQGKHKSCPK